MAVQFHNSAILFDSGQVAMDPDCCCEDCPDCMQAVIEGAVNDTLPPLCSGLDPEEQCPILNSTLQSNPPEAIGEPPCPVTGNVCSYSFAAESVCALGSEPTSHFLWVGRLANGTLDVVMQLNLDPFGNEYVAFRKFGVPGPISAIDTTFDSGDICDQQTTWCDFTNTTIRITTCPQGFAMASPQIEYRRGKPVVPKGCKGCQEIV